MTRPNPALRRIACLLFGILALLPGCGKEVEAFPDPGGMTETVEVIRLSDSGPILLSFSPFPLRREAPPDGVRRALRRIAAMAPSSAASFYWAGGDLPQRWLSEQLERRRARGETPRIILIGHSLGATEAAETAWHIVRRESDAVIDLLITVDAIKTGRIGSAAGVTGTVIAGALPGVKMNLTSYDSAPGPDGRRLLAHVNYYQRQTSLYHGSDMPQAENHLLQDDKGLLNHGNADDFAFPYVVADMLQALRAGGQQ